LLDSLLQEIIVQHQDVTFENSGSLLNLGIR